MRARFAPASLICWLAPRWGVIDGKRSPPSASASPPSSPGRGGRARARPGHRARRRRPRLARLRRQQAQGLRGGRDPLDPPRAARPTSARPSSTGSSPSSTPTRGRRDPRADAAPRGHRPGPRARRDLGRARTSTASPDQRRAARPRAGSALPRRSRSSWRAARRADRLHPERRHRDAAPLRCRARRCRGRDRRPLDPRRPADGQPDARRERDGHRLSLPDPRSRRRSAGRADVLVAAVGVPELVRGDWVKPGATVIDVGINRTDGGLVGDVEFGAAAEVAAAITPVPGGVGPMTIAMLLANTVRASRRAIPPDGAVRSASGYREALRTPARRMIVDTGRLHGGADRRGVCARAAARSCSLRLVRGRPATSASRSARWPTASTRGSRSASSTSSCFVTILVAIGGAADRGKRHERQHAGRDERDHAGLGILCVLLILFRIIDTPDRTSTAARRLARADRGAGIVYGGWRRCRRRGRTSHRRPGGSRARRRTAPPRLIAAAGGC